MQRFAVIMAGGSGERFWPASRRLRPKQLLRLTDPEQSMIAEAIARIAPLIPPERVLIATSAALAEPIAAALPDFPRDNIVAEPEKRNTAACLALAAVHLVERCGDPARISVAVLTADHEIGEPERFRAAVDAALDFAEREDALVTIGVVPSRPESGYGYIEVAAPIVSPGESTSSEKSAAKPGKGATHEPARVHILPVVRFLEKPDAATALEFSRSGRHLWNSGMFFWRVSTFLDGLELHMAELARATRAMRRALAIDTGAGAGTRAGSRAGSGASDDALREAFLPLADIPVDVGLMEHARNVHVLPATFPWDDVGAWDALARTRSSDGAGNVVEGEAVLVDAEGCIVYNEPGGERMAVVVIGVDDLVVATTADGVLVCRKDRAQDVRRAVAELRSRGRGRFT